MKAAPDHDARRALLFLERQIRQVSLGLEGEETRQFWVGAIDFTARNEAALGMSGAGPFVVLPMERADNGHARHALNSVEQSVRQLTGDFTGHDQYEQFWRGFADFCYRNGSALGIRLGVSSAT